MRKKSPELEMALRMALNGMDFEKAWKKCGRPGTESKPLTHPRGRRSRAVKK